MYEVKSLQAEQLTEALSLVWEVFCRFEAPEYSEEGVAEFKNFLNNKEEIGKLDFYGAFDAASDIVGVLAMRKPSHISLFFVKAEYHRKGIGRQLFEKMLIDYLLQGIGVFTVNSSPYAVEVYRKLGFEPTDDECITNGIRYTPMKMERGTKDGFD